MPRGTTTRHAGACLVPLLLLLAACGAPASRAGTAPSAIRSSATTAPAPPARPGSPSSAPATAPGPAATHPVRTGGTSTSVAPTDPAPPSGLPSSAPLRVRLAHPCVTPGGEQRIVVESVPNAFVAYDNLYPDRRTGAAHGGAEAHGRTGSDGALTGSWRVTPDTPYGRVRVDVGVSARSGSAITMTYYRLAAEC